MRFLDEKYNFFELESADKLTQSIINVFRVIRMLGDFQQHGSILRRYYKQKELLKTDELKQFLQSYNDCFLQKEYSKITRNYYRKIAEIFLSFLESQGVRQPTNITSKHITGYISTLLGYRASLKITVYDKINGIN
jgi:integrase/recombinase XerD